MCALRIPAYLSHHPDLVCLGRAIELKLALGRLGIVLVLEAHLVEELPRRLQRVLQLVLLACRLVGAHGQLRAQNSHRTLGGVHLVAEPGDFGRLCERRKHTHANT